MRPVGSTNPPGTFPVSVNAPSLSPVVEVQPSRAVATYVFGSGKRYRWSLVALPSSTIRSPVANGSSVPACPTFPPRSRRTRSTRSCEVIPAGLSQIRMPAAAGSELLADLLTQQLDQLGVSEVGRETRRPLVPAAAVLASDRRDIDGPVRRP